MAAGHLRPDGICAFNFIFIFSYYKNRTSNIQKPY